MPLTKTITLKCDLCGDEKDEVSVPAVPLETLQSGPIGDRSWYIVMRTHHKGFGSAPEHFKVICRGCAEQVAKFVGVKDG